MTMFPNAMRSCSYFSVLPDLKFQQTLKYQHLDCEDLSSSLILTSLFSNSFVSLTNVLKVSSNHSTSWARSRSLMLLMSAADAECSCQTCSSDRSSSRSRAMHRIPSVIAFVELFSAAHLLLLCPTPGTVTPQFFRTPVISPSSDNACIHKCKSDMKSELSLFVAPFPVPWDEVAGSIWRLSRSAPCATVDFVLP